MSGSKENSAYGAGRGRGAGRGSGGGGGGRDGSRDGGCGAGGGGRGLRGGKIKHVAAGKHIDRDIVIDLNLGRGASDVASGKRVFEMSDPKHPSKKVVVDKNNVWSHGPYLSIRPPDGNKSSFKRVGAVGSSSHLGESDEITIIRSPGGKTSAYKRMDARSSSHVGEGDETADVAGLSDDTTALHVSRDIVDDEVFSEDFGGGHSSDHGDGGDNDGGGDEGEDDGVGVGVGVGVGDVGVGDGRQFIQCNETGYISNLTF
ncbi:hypothetical protein Hanom_Chr12g01127411 [Helianthus anomalus]